MKFRKDLLITSLIIMLALSLGGCGVQNSKEPHQQLGPRTTAKIVKRHASNHQRLSQQNDSPEIIMATPVVAKTNNGTKIALTSQPVFTQRPVTPAINLANVYSGVPLRTEPALAPAPAKARPVNYQVATEQLPAEYCYYWVWNDGHGRTHNANWDLNDYVNNGTGQLAYRDFAYEQQPAHATQYDTRDFNLHYDGTNQWVFRFDNQIQATPNHGIVNQY